MMGLRRDQECHLADRVADYVDGVLDPAEQDKADRHLMVCEYCCHAVRQEREIIAQLRSVLFDSGGHQQMMAGLLSLAGSQPDAPARPVSNRPAPAVVTASAPPQYQSARRSMACALVAVAGCVGVALVASTASGVASGPDTAPARVPLGGPAALVRAATPSATASSVSRSDTRTSAERSATHSIARVNLP